MHLCDTDFIGTNGINGGKFATAAALAEHIAALWPSQNGSAQSKATPYVVFTGGEPLLQLDATLIATLHSHGFEVAVETNGTLTPPQALTGYVSALRAAIRWPLLKAMN
ncbi:hypothetical protein HORIV_32710 [Vreelandella olivaria]|uniref:Radical SAM core domain-containing protein n=1 Tax=Vreelandella olivaria TaxID=390919 RepID=A0ABM7GJN0_9GAMM|nr:hypothetical protein HORIV_32710 [Halomonas olivaria]